MYLTRGWRTADLPDGDYRIEVLARDVRGNVTRSRSRLLIANHWKMPIGR